MSDNYGIFSGTGGEFGDFGSSGTYGGTDAQDTTTYLFRDAPVGGSWNPSRVDGQPTPIRTLELSELATLPEHQQHMVIKTSNPAGLGMNLSQGGQQSAREEFTHGGQSYYKENGQTYMVNPEAIGGVDVLHPERAAEIERQRAEEKAQQEEEKARLEEQRKVDAEKWRKPTTEEAKDLHETFDTIAKYGAGTIGGILSMPFAGTAAGLVGIGISQGVGAALDLTNKRRIESYLQNGQVPILEKMTPDEIADYYGRP